MVGGQGIIMDKKEEELGKLYYDKSFSYESLEGLAPLFGYNTTTHYYPGKNPQMLYTRKIYSA